MTRELGIIRRNIGKQKLLALHERWLWADVLTNATCLQLFSEKDNDFVFYKFQITFFSHTLACHHLQPVY